MKHILIIEDNIEIAELERDFLEAADFAVTIAPDGEQGLAALRADGADFALVALAVRYGQGFTRVALVQGPVQAGGAVQPAGK